MGIKKHKMRASRSMKKSEQIPLYGLVLAGGKSRRMGKDKSLLEYHGKKQTIFCFELLARFCDQVFISNRQGQAHLAGHKALPQIHDTFLDIGPLGGILSAMSRFPQAAWLVLACDLPFVNDTAVEILIKNRNPSRIATAYRSAHEPDQPEPLCAIYEPKAGPRLLEFLGRGIQCPRFILENSNTHLVKPPATFLLDNINDPREYEKALHLIRGGVVR